MPRRGGGHRIDRSTAPDFEIGFETTGVGHCDHLPVPVDPESGRRGIAALVVEADDDVT